MSQTVLLPIEGKDQYKIANLSEEQVKSLREDPNNIFKALAIGGGTFLAYETFKHVVNIPREDWENMLPDELENFLAPFLKNKIDVEETITENETEHFTDNEIHSPEEHEAIVIDKDDNQQEDHENKTEINETIIDEPIDEQDQIDDNNATTIEIDDISEVLEDEGIDQDMTDHFVEDADFSIDSEMMDYINSDEIIMDLNDASAEEIVINDEYLDGSEITFEDFEIDDDSSDLSNIDDMDDYTEDYDQSYDYIEHEDYEDNDDFIEDIDEQDDYEDNDYTDDIDLDDIEDNL